MMYNIYKFQENQRTFLSSLHFTFFTSLHNQPAAWAFGSLGFRFAGGGGRWRADMASGSEGFGIERARLAGDGVQD